MRTWVAALGTLLVAFGAIVAGCSGGRRAVAAAVSAAAAQPPSVRCGEAAVVGPSLRLVRARLLSLPGTPDGVATTPDGRTSFVAIQSGVPRIAVIDTSTDTVAKWVPLDGLGYGSTPTPDGRWLLMTVPSANKISVVDLKTMQVVQSVETPPDPEEVIVQPGGKTAWVSCPNSAQVAEIDLASWKVTRKIVTGKSSDGLAWAKAR